MCGKMDGKFANNSSVFESQISLNFRLIKALFSSCKSSPSLTCPLTADDKLKCMCGKIDGKFTYNTFVFES
jgi:hypothetical protein